MYRQIQYIRVICYTIFLLAGDTQSLQLVIGDVYEADFMFLSMIILDSNSLCRNIDVCLRPLIDEMNQLWLFRTLIYDVSSKLNFQKKVALMWTINDFHAYEIVFG
jgi:hypothetical protein